MISALVGAGASLLGGAMARSSQREANNIAQSQYNQNVALQREFAQNGIRWRVEDAKRAGLHPLYALGQAGASYTPQATVSHSPLDYSDISSAGGYLSQGLGQSITRARESKQSYAERAIEELRAEQQYQYTNRMQELQLQNQQLQNQALSVEIAQMAANSARSVRNTAQVPALPVSDLPDGQGDKNQYLGSIPQLTKVLDHNGNVVGFAPSSEFAEILESDLVGSGVWYLGQYIDALDGSIAGHYKGEDGYWHEGSKPSGFWDRFKSGMSDAVRFYNNYGG